MKTLRKIFTALLILLTLNLYLPNITFAEAGITKRKPEIVSTPEKKKPPKPPYKKWWFWTIVASGYAICCASGGCGCGPDDDGSDTGSVTGSW